MATGDQTFNEVAEALDRDFRFNLALLQNLFYNLPATIDEQKILRWVTRLTVEPRPGHTDTSRRIRNSYLKLIVLNVQQGFLDPQLDKKNPPSEGDYLPPLQIQSPNSPPIWLEKMTPAGDSDMKILLELSRDVTLSEDVAIESDKRSNPKKHRNIPALSLNMPIPSSKPTKKLISSNKVNTSGDSTIQDYRSAKEFCEVYHDGDGETGPQVAEYLMSSSKSRPPMCAGDSTEAKTVKRRHRHKTQLRSDKAREYLKTSLNFDLHPLSEEKLKKILPRSLLEELRAGISDTKKDIRESHFKKMHADLCLVMDMARSILRQEKDKLNMSRHDYLYLVSLDKMLKKAQKAYFTKLQELEKTVIRKGFLGVTNSERLRNAVTTLQNLRAQKEKLLNESSCLDREWNTVRLKWMVRNLRTAMEGASSDVRTLLSRRFPRRIRPFKY